MVVNFSVPIYNGVSRFGAQSGRGTGFRPIFVGLANLAGMLRFRSGDHALVIDGQKIGDMSAVTAQKVRLPVSLPRYPACSTQAPGPHSSLQGANAGSESLAPPSAQRRARHPS